MHAIAMTTVVRECPAVAVSMSYCMPVVLTYCVCMLSDLHIHAHGRVAPVTATMQ
jgi:hypothetical protein